MKKIFRVIVNVQEEDFCASDLEECISDGSENIGNHTITAIAIQEDYMEVLQNGISYQS